MYINIYILNNNYNKKRAKQKQTNKITELQKANIEVQEIKSVIFQKVLKSLNRDNNDKNNKPQLQRKKKKKKKLLNQLRKNQNIKIVINVFLESQLFTPLSAIAHLCFPRRPSSTGRGWGTGLSGPAVVTAEPILALLLRVLAPSVHSCQSQGIFFCGNAHCPFIYSLESESTQLIM